MKTGIFVKLIVIALGMLSFSAIATHSPGAKIYYQWISGNQYMVHVEIYRDCAGITASGSVSICFSSVSNNYTDSLNLTLTGPGIVLPNFPYFPPFVSSCAGGTGYGLEKYHYSDTLTLPFPANDWLLAFKTHSDTNFNPQEYFRYGYYVSTTIDNINYQNNSSAQFTSDPMFQYCIGQQAWEIYPAVDIDGDSLVYSLEPVLVDSINCPYQPFTITAFPLNLSFQPISSQLPYNIHPNAGWITLLPDFIQIGTICIKVSEFRNGLLINQTTFTHMQSAASGCILTNTQQPNQKSKGIHIYPTILNDKLNIFNENLSGYNITIFDTNGSEVYKNILQSNSAICELHLGFLNSGIYIITFEPLISESRKIKYQTEQFKILKY